MLGRQDTFAEAIVYYTEINTSFVIINTTCVSVQVESVGYRYEKLEGDQSLGEVYLIKLLISLIRSLIQRRSCTNNASLQPCKHADQFANTLRTSYKEL